MEIKKTPVQIPLTWLHVWLLFAGIYGFAAGFLELTGQEALYFCAISLLLLIPAAASWILIRKTKALWQFLLGGIAVCAVTYLAAKFFCSLFSVQAAAVIEAAAAANDGKNKFENGISPAFLESLSGVMTGSYGRCDFPDPRLCQNPQRPVKESSAGTAGRLNAAGGYGSVGDPDAPR